MGEQNILTKREYEEGLYKSHSLLINVLCFTLGLITYLGAGIIGSSAKVNSEDFVHKDLMATFVGLPTFCGLLAQALNSTCFMKVRHIIKISFISSAWILSFLIYFSAYLVPNDYGFVCALLAAMLLGSFSAVAGNTITGFMKAFPP